MKPTLPSAVPSSKPERVRRGVVLTGLVVGLALAACGESRSTPAGAEPAAAAPVPVPPNVGATAPGAPTAATPTPTPSAPTAATPTPTSSAPTPTAATAPAPPSGRTIPSVPGRIDCTAEIDLECGPGLENGCDRGFTDYQVCIQAETRAFITCDAEIAGICPKGFLNACAANPPLGRFHVCVKQ